jgi:hypothetical protein
MGKNVSKIINPVSVFMTPLVAFIIYVFNTLLIDGDVPKYALHEELLDQLQFFIYLSAGIFFISSFRAIRNWFLKLPMLLLISITFLTAFEEINWGQVYFDFLSPDYFILNSTQSELSIHNLSNLQVYLHSAYIEAGLILSFSWLILKRSKFKLVVPNWYLTSYFLPISIYYSLWEYSRKVDYFILWNQQEYFEFFFSVGILIWAITLKQKSNKIKLLT